jgi:hypothetical protein
MTHLTRFMSHGGVGEVPPYETVRPTATALRVAGRRDAGGYGRLRRVER